MGITGDNVCNCVCVLQSSRVNEKVLWMCCSSAAHFVFVTLSEKQTYKGGNGNECARTRALYAKCVTFVSAWIQSCCVSCVSAPTISTRSVCRYSSTVNTALPETHSPLLDIWDGTMSSQTHTHKEQAKKSVYTCTHTIDTVKFKISQ